MCGGRVADSIKSLTAQLAADPSSLVFLELGEELRRKGQLATARKVALQGLERHPHLADAHDLYARVLADQHDFERAFDEWDMAVRIAPHHAGALKGLGFLYFKVGDLTQAVAHLEAARRAAPNDASIAQALATVQGYAAEQSSRAEPKTPQPVPSPRRGAPVPPVAPPAPEAEPAKVFAGLDGAESGLLLVDTAGQVLGGGIKTPAGEAVTEVVAAHLAGVSQEAARTAKLLVLGTWSGVSAEGRLGHVYLAQPTPESLLLLARDKSVPLGRLVYVAERAKTVARRWLEEMFG
jgi:tetratricopeptide (TPR) repeat protein